MKQLCQWAGGPVSERDDFQREAYVRRQLDRQYLQPHGLELSRATELGSNPTKLPLAMSVIVNWIDKVAPVAPAA